MEFASNGDFHHALIDNDIPYDEVLTRTYFSQLIDALSYLHNREMAHMDLKLENILLGDQYQLKLIDFDLSFSKKVGKVKGRGTVDYRSPELKDRKKDLDVYKCDIYSAGIFLFALYSRGILPFKEGNKTNRLFEDFQISPKLFWANHQKIQQKGKEFWSNSFRELFEAMCNADPKKRPTINEIKKFEWLQGPTYSQKEVRNIMKKIFNSSSPKKWE